MNLIHINYEPHLYILITSMTPGDIDRLTIWVIRGHSLISPPHTCHVLDFHIGNYIVPKLYLTFFCTQDNVCHVLDLHMGI